MSIARNKQVLAYSSVVCCAGLAVVLSISLSCAVVVSANPGPMTLSIAMCSLIACFLTQFLEIYGMLRFGAPREPHEAGEKKLSENPLTVCVVSSGRQLDVLGHTVEVAYEVLSRLCPEFTIEVVVEPLDRPWSLPQRKQVVVVEVDKAFEALAGSRFKARALEYARRARNDRGTTSAWILHLDEESLLTDSAVHGINRFIAEHRGVAVVGQGEINYNSMGYGTNLLTAACDSWRAGTDLGLQRAQMEGLGTMYVGLHGSFLLIPKEVEDRIGFDFGPEGSVAEDAFFALAATELGIPFKWINGVVREQSPQSLFDVLKQRRRWLQGTVKMLLCPRFSKKRRAIVAAHILLKWATLCMPATALLCLPGSVSGSLTEALIVGSLIIVLFSIDPPFLVGLYRNVHTLDNHFSTKYRLFLSILSLAPVAVIINRIAVPFFSLITKENGFFIISKVGPEPETPYG